MARRKGGLGQAVLDLIVNKEGLTIGLQNVQQETLRTLTTVQRSFDRAGRQLGQSGQQMTLGITVPVLAAGRAITDVGVNYQQTLNQIVGLTDVTRDQLAGVKSGIDQIAKDTGKVPQELAEAYYFVASAGFNAAEAMDVLKTAAQASATGLGATQDIAKVLGLTLNAYGHDNITAAHAADVLVAAVKDGTAEADAFASVLGRVVPTAATLGVSFDQVTGALSAMTLTGLNADEAATSLQQVFVSLLKPTSQAADTMDTLGLSAQGLRTELKEQGLLATLQTLQNAFQGNDEAATQVFGNVRALRGVLSLLTLDSSQLEKVFNDTADASGNLAQGYKETEGPARDLARAQAEIQSALIDLSTDVIPVVVDVVRRAADIIRDLAHWFEGLPAPVKQATVEFLAMAAAIGPALVVAAGLSRVIATLVGGIKLIPQAMGLILNLPDTFRAVSTAVSGIPAALGNVAGGIKALGTAAVTSLPELVAIVGIAATLAAAYAAAAASVEADIQRIIDSSKDAISSGSMAQLLGIREEIQARLSRTFPIQGSLLFGSTDEQRRLLAALDDVNAAIRRMGADLTPTSNSIQRGMDKVTQVMEDDARRQAAGLAGAGQATSDYATGVGQSLADALAAQKKFAADMLASIQQFRTDLEGVYGAAQSAESDLSDTQLAIAQKLDELAKLDAETPAKVKKSSSLQGQEYRNRRLHILQELSALKLHAALIGDDMQKEQALTALLTGKEMKDGLTSKMPEVKAAYEQLRDDSVAALITLQQRGGTAGEAAAKDLASLFDPSNTQSPFHGMQDWGSAAIREYIKGLTFELSEQKHAVERALRKAALMFEAHSPPGPESPLHDIGIWGGRAGHEYVRGLAGAIVRAGEALRSPLGRLGDMFGATSFVSPGLRLAAAGSFAAASGVSTGVSASLIGAAASGGGAPTFGPITIHLDARGHADPASFGRAAKTAIADAMADVVREQTARYVPGRKNP